MPAQFVGQFAGGGSFDIDRAPATSGPRSWRPTPPAQQALVQPLIPGIVAAVHDAFSIAIASSFWVGIVGAIIGAVVVLFLEEVPMRATFEMTETETA